MVLYARVVRGRRQPPQRVLRQPVADPLVDGRVVQQPEVVGPRDVAAVLRRERNPAPPAFARCAAVRDEEIAHEPTGSARIGRERRGDEAVRRRLEERALAAAIAEKLVGIAVAPVLLEAAAEAKVLDAGAAPGDEEVRERPRLREARERP